MPLNNENNNECCKCTTPEIYIELNQQGPQGRQGNPGVDGVSPEITVAQNTNTSYVLKIEDANGSFTTPNLKANLPLGGVDGQMLVKLSNEDGVVGWEGDIDNLVTLDGEQEITGNKTFSNDTVFNNYIQTQLLDGEDNTPTTIIGVENYHQNVDNPPVLMFGNPEHNTLLRGTTLEAKVGDDYYSLLHQGNVTAGDNVTITPTDNGIQIASTTEPYTLPQANATTLGGVKANEKTDEDTQAVNIDPATGLLYTKAGGGEVPDNVAILTENQTFTGHNYFNGQVNFNSTVQFTNQQVNIPKLYSSNTITGSNITLDSPGKSYKFPCEEGTLSLSATSGDEAGTKAGLYINGAGIDNKRLLTEDDLSSGDAYSKTETDELLDAKQNKLVAGTGITISGNNEIYLDRTSYINNSINYVNKDTSYGEIKNNIFYQLQNNTFNNPVNGFKSLGFNIPSEQINSFDFIVCVKLVSPYTDSPGNIMRIGLGNTEVSVDTVNGSQSERKLRFSVRISGTSKTFLNTDITDTQYTLLRLKHIGTDNTLRIYSLLSDVAKLPEEDEWVSVGTVDWNISQYQPSTESGDLHLQELFSIGGVNITNLGEDKTYGMQSGNYYLAFTRLIVNENIIFNGSAISNPAEATKDEYGLVKIDFSTITTNSNGQLQANIPSNITTQGNTFNGASQLVQLDSTGKLPAIDGSQLTNLPSTTPTNMVTTDTPQDITAIKTFKSGSLIFYNENKPKIAINNIPGSISLSYEGNISNDSSQILRDTSSDWRVGRYNKQGIISSSTPLQRMGADPYFNLYPILDSSNLGSYVDGTTITYTDGKLKASGGSAPSNMVTTDTNQTITGTKTFNSFIVKATGTGQKNVIRANISTSSSGHILTNVLGIYTDPDTYANTLRIGQSIDNVKIGSKLSYSADGQFTFDNQAVITTKDIGNLKYWTGTEAEYTAIETKDVNMLYRTTDTNKVYLGTIQLGG